MTEKIIEGTYGSQFTPCQVFVCGAWYVVEGGSTVNRAACLSALVDGVDVETIQDVDCFTTSEVNSLEGLVSEVDDFVYG